MKNRRLFNGTCFVITAYHKFIYKQCMKNKVSNSSRRGFAAMDPDKRREVAKKGGHASGSKNEIENKEDSAPAFARGFAAMDEEKRRQIAKRGGSVSRRNRIVSQEQVVIL